MGVPPVLNVVAASAVEKLGDKRPFEPEFRHCREELLILAIGPLFNPDVRGEITEPALAALARTSTGHVQGNAFPAKGKLAVLNDIN
jgi:hypothetical protein